MIPNKLKDFDNKWEICSTSVKVSFAGHTNKHTKKNRGRFPSAHTKNCEKKVRQSTEKKRIAHGVITCMHCERSYMFVHASRVHEVRRACLRVQKSMQSRACSTCVLASLWSVVGFGKPLSALPRRRRQWTGTYQAGGFELHIMLFTNVLLLYCNWKWNCNRMDGEILEMPVFSFIVCICMLIQKRKRWKLIPIFLLLREVQILKYRALQWTSQSTYAYAEVYAITCMQCVYAYVYIYMYIYRCMDIGFTSHIVQVHFTWSA